MISKRIREEIEEASWIRRMFEEGIRMRRSRGEDKVFDFSLGNPDVEPPNEVKEALVRALLDPRRGLHRYMPNNGFEESREEIASYLSEHYGLSFSKDHVFMTSGCAGGMNIILKTLLDRGDEVIIPSPYFMEYRYYVESHGGVPRLVDTDTHFQLSVEAIEEAISDRTKAIIINSPNNPTGAVYHETLLRSLAELLQRERRKGRFIYIVSDEAYRKFVYEGLTLPNLFRIYDLLFAVYTHSKDLALPGERIGYIAISPYLEHLETIVSGLMFSSRALGFVNAPALFQRTVPRFQRNSIDVADYEQKRDMFYQGLIAAGLEVVKPQGAFYMFPRSPCQDELEFVQALKEEEGILVVPGRGFGKKGYVRIAYCVPKEKIERAIDGFKRVTARFLKKG
jgi:aspartate aminotransferase